jgi:hypothetical protein
MVMSPGVGDPIQDLRKELVKACGRYELAECAFRLVTEAHYSVDAAVAEVLAFEAAERPWGLNAALDRLYQRVDAIVQASKRDEREAQGSQ